MRHICGYCNVDNPDPPVGFIIKGMPITTPKTQLRAYSGTINHQQAGTIQRPPTTPNTFGANGVIPTLINPSTKDILLKKAKRADLTSEINAIFERNNIPLTYNQKLDVHKLHDIFTDYTKYVRENPLFIKQKKESAIKYIAENIKHYFKIGVAAYLVKNEYGEYIGRWSDQQYIMFIDSLKKQTFMLYYDMLNTFEDCIDDISQFIAVH